MEVDVKAAGNFGIPKKSFQQAWNFSLGCYILQINGGVEMGFEVKEVQATPNPNALKFVLDRVIAQQPTSFFKAEAATGHPLAAKLFEITGVTSVLLLGDFVTVNKQPQAKWSAISKKVRRVLAEA